MALPEATPVLRFAQPILRKLALTIWFLTALTGVAQAEPTNVLLVLDASGSMFVQLPDGQYRITAAKAALAELVSRLPDDPELRVGLRVYGSRIGAIEDGACRDSALVAPVAPLGRDALLGSIRATQAKGATPIAYSLELAAEDLRDLAGRKVVVLVTDGAESCGGDLRAAVERLTAAGLEVDLRIIGFDLSAVAAKSFDGLGTFENAGSAAELAGALGRAVDVAPTTATFRATVALTRRGEPARDGATVRFVDAVGGGAFDFAVGADGIFAAQLPAGAYRAEVADAFAAEPLLVGGLTVAPVGANAFAFELEPAVQVTLTVAPEAPAAGGSVAVAFAGAGEAGDRDWIAIAPADSGDDVYLVWGYVSGPSGEVELRVPDDAGRFEARYHRALPEGGTQVVGRSAPFTTAAVRAEVSAPAEVAAGAPFEVVWSGPSHGGDYLTVVPAGAPEATYLSYAYTDRGNPATLTAPIGAGAYEVRYVTGQSQRTAASVPLIVTAASVGVSAPAEVGAGTPFEVNWSGPANAGDYLTIVPAGAPEGTYLSYAYTDRGSPATLTAPIDPGAHEVRYVSGQGDRTLASAPIVVAPARIALTVPAEVAPGASFDVAWDGPDGSGDYLTIVPEGAAEGSYLSYAYTDRGSPATLTAPAEAGRYEVRYVSGQGDRTLASAPIEVR